MKFVLLSFVCAAGAALAGTIVTDLGSLGGSAAQAFALNAGGEAVGSATNSFGYTHAFSNFGSGIVELTLSNSASEATASGINDASQIAGTQYINGQPVATVWSNGTPHTIAPAGSFGTAINDAGTTTGMLADGHAFSMLNGAVTDLGAGAGAWSAGYSINSSGQIAGYGEISTGVFRGFVWTPTTGFVEIGTLGGASSYAMSINDAGQVAGSAQTSSGTSHAFLWSHGSMHDLGTLGGASYAYGVDSWGDVVGYSYIDGAQHAFLYHHGVMIDLNSLIDPSSGWVLEAAYAINANGQIAGAGLLNGVEHAFLLDYAAPTAIAANSIATSSVAAPEPATWILALLGIGLIFSSRLRIRPRPRQPPRHRKREPR